MNRRQLFAGFGALLATPAFKALPLKPPRTLVYNIKPEEIVGRNLLTVSDYAGEAFVSYQGIPIRIVDKLLDEER